MQVCECCGKQKVKKSMTLKFGKESQKLETDLYDCRCPQFLLYELAYMREKNIKLNLEERNKLRYLYKDKRIFG